MDSPRRFDWLTLRYTDTHEHKIDNRQSVHIESSEYAVFGFVRKESVKVTLKDDQAQRAGNAAAGELFFVPAGCRCSIQNREGHASHVVLIRFQWEGASEQAPAGRPLGYGLRTFKIPHIRNWIQDFLADDGNREPAYYFLLQAHLYAMAHAWVSAAGKPRNAVEDGLTEYVEQMKQTMLTRYTTAMDMEELARMSGVSVSRFYQAFRTHTGLTPHKFITTVRLNESLRLLASAPDTIMEVAHAVGYPDELYFSRLFKKHMGISPTEYINYAKIRIANLSPVFQGDLAVLGITPVLSLKRGWMDDPEPYIKQIELSQPELIMTPPVSEDVHRALSRIAPVYVFKWKGRDWKERLALISDKIGIPTVAERWLAYYDIKAENARYHIRKHLRDEPYLVIGKHTGIYRVFGMQVKKMSDLFYDELQIAPPADVKQLVFLDSPALDEIARLACDHAIFLVPYAMTEEECGELTEQWRELKRNPLARIWFIRFEEPLLYNPSIHENMIDQLVNLLMHGGEPS
ncbi:helix-turn-helix domain-containing protein [Paenibacillus sp. MBLB4367]|uniref:helix-turn-helix domain-containing protein n=1 Tax=Paenibacillus sp. MBLB4367 TaxID=3384767 RepID=UPI0039082672